MGKRRQKRHLSMGSIFMILWTAGCVAMGLFVFSRLSGYLGDVQLSPAAMIQGLVATAPPATQSPAAQTTASPETTPETQETAQPAPAQAPRVITINAVGQIGLDNTLRRSGLQESGNYDYQEIFTDIAPYMSRSDITLVTLETAVAGESLDYDSYNAPDAILDALGKAGVDIINLGTERILDKGFEGLAKTRDTAERMGFDVTGAHRSAQEQQLPLTFVVQDIKVACLSYTYGLSSTGGKKGTAEQRAWAVNLLDPEQVRQDVQKARAQGAQLVLVNVHWGKRSNTKPSSDVLKLADQLASCGADAILGTHPTSVHSMERRTVTLEDGRTQEVFIAYSLGNFLTNERDDAATITGTLLTLEFTLDPGADRVRLTNARYMPTWVMRYQTDSYHYRILPAGSASQPPEMTNSVYRNMSKAYENQLKTLGTEAAAPYAE